MERFTQDQTRQTEAEGETETETQEVEEAGGIESKEAGQSFRVRSLSYLCN